MKQEPHIYFILALDDTSYSNKCPGALEFMSPKNDVQKCGQICKILVF